MFHTGTSTYLTTLSGINHAVVETIAVPRHIIFLGNSSDWTSERVNFDRGYGSYAHSFDSNLCTLTAVLAIISEISRDFISLEMKS